MDGSNAPTRDEKGTTMSTRDKDRTLPSLDSFEEASINGKRARAASGHKSHRGVGHSPTLVRVRYSPASPVSTDML